MDKELKRIISNLVYLYGKEEIVSIIKFAIYFRSDNLKLYEEFKKKVDSRGFIDTKDIINLLAKRYDLDPKQNMEQIRNMYVNNVINMGYAFHLTPKANVESIDECGLNPGYLEEQEDIKRVRSELSEQAENNLFTFAKDDYNKLYFSRTLNLRVSYGREPEWIRELNKNKSMLDTYMENETDKAKKDVKELMAKYNAKYQDKSRVLYLIPNSYTFDKKKVFTSDDLDNLNISPEEIIERFESINREVINASVPTYVPRSELICIDLSNGMILESNQEKMTV